MSYAFSGRASLGDVVATATSKAVSVADQATYGAASEALAQGQSMWAFAQMAAAQNYPGITVQKDGKPWSCPPGFAWQSSVCISPNGVRVWPCDGAKWSCDLLYRYVVLDAAGGSTKDGGYSADYITIVKSMIDGLNKLGALVPNQWPLIEQGVYSIGAGFKLAPWNTVKLLDVAKSVYEDAIKQYKSTAKPVATIATKSTATGTAKPVVKKLHPAAAVGAGAGAAALLAILFL